jgi:hypothetical protein
MFGTATHFVTDLQTVQHFDQREIQGETAGIVGVAEGFAAICRTFDGAISNEFGTTFGAEGVTTRQESRSMKALRIGLERNETDTALETAVLDWILQRKENGRVEQRIKTRGKTRTGDESGCGFHTFRRIVGARRRRGCSFSFATVVCARVHHCCDWRKVMRNKKKKQRKKKKERKDTFFQRKRDVARHLGEQRSKNTRRKI